MDTLHFLARSLETIASNLFWSGNDLFEQLGPYFQVNRAAHTQFDMLLGKGVFPYDHLAALEKRNEPALPARDALFSLQYNEPCSEADYAPALDVWQTFKSTTLQQYLELYLKTDVLLLADIFEDFPGVCLQNYGLDPAHYVSSR